MNDQNVSTKSNKKQLDRFRDQLANVLFDVVERAVYSLYNVSDVLSFISTNSEASQNIYFNNFLNNTIQRVSKYLYSVSDLIYLVANPPDRIDSVLLSEYLCPNVDIAPDLESVDADKDCPDMTVDDVLDASSSSVVECGSSDAPDAEHADVLAELGQKTVMSLANNMLSDVLLFGLETDKQRDLVYRLCQVLTGEFNDESLWGIHSILMAGDSSLAKDYANILSECIQEHWGVDSFHNGVCEDIRKLCSLRSGQINHLLARQEKLINLINGIYSSQYKCHQENTENLMSRNFKYNLPLQSVSNLLILVLYDICELGLHDDNLNKLMSLVCRVFCRKYDDQVFDEIESILANGRTSLCETYYNAFVYMRRNKFVVFERKNDTDEKFNLLYKDRSKVGQVDTTEQSECMENLRDIRKSTNENTNDETKREENMNPVLDNDCQGTTNSLESLCDYLIDAIKKTKFSSRRTKPKIIEFLHSVRNGLPLSVSLRYVSEKVDKVADLKPFADQIKTVLTTVDSSRQMDKV